MAKSIITENCVCIMHFNSNIQSYTVARQEEAFSVECCYCHYTIYINLPPEPSGPYGTKCPHCQKPIAYLSLIMDAKLTQYFEIKGGFLTGDVSSGSVMHIILPPTFPSFQALLEQPKSALMTRKFESIREWFIANIHNKVHANLLSLSDKIKATKQLEGNSHIFMLCDGFYLFGKMFSSKIAIIPQENKDQLEQFENDIARQYTDIVIEVFRQRLEYLEATPPVESNIRKTSLPFKLDILPYEPNALISYVDRNCLDKLRSLSNPA